jgi:hypothetical protein
VKPPGMAAGAAARLPGWASGISRLAAVLGGIPLSTADDSQPAGRAPAATARRSTDARACVRLGAAVSGRSCSRCELAAAVQTLASTRRTSSRDAAGGGRRRTPSVLQAVQRQAAVVVVAAPCG